MSNPANRSGQVRHMKPGGGACGQWVDQISLVDHSEYSAERRGAGEASLTHNRRAFSLPCDELKAQLKKRKRP